MKRIFIFGAVAAFLWVGQFSQAQTASTGALVGTVTDASGAVVPGAQIVATSNATGRAITVISNTHGTYQVPLLQPGNYAVDATKEGFKATDFDHVTVKVTETSTLNVTLQSRRGLAESRRQFQRPTVGHHRCSTGNSD